MATYRIIENPEFHLGMITGYRFHLQRKIFWSWVYVRGHDDHNNLTRFANGLVKPKVVETFV